MDYYFWLYWKLILSGKNIVPKEWQKTQQDSGCAV